MSWIDSGAGGADVKIRRSFYVRGLASGSSDVTFRINDQLPQNYVFRVRAEGCVSGTSTGTVTSNQLIEVRLYNAFTTERIYDSNQEGGFLILGWCVGVNGASNLTTQSAGQYLWRSAPAIESRSTGSGIWRLVLYDLATDGAMDSTKFGAFSFAIDVRAGGPISYPN